MASATIPNSAGPGSSIQLDPQTIKVRDAVIARCETQTLEQMNEFVKSLLANETDELKRLGILAARVFILRQRITTLGSDGKIVDAKTLIRPEDAEQGSSKAKGSDENDAEAAIETGWTRLRVTNECEVNGMRFFEGVIVDVRDEDAARLIESGNAEVQGAPATSDKAAKTEDTPPKDESPAAETAAEDDKPTADAEAADDTSKEAEAEEATKDEDASPVSEATETEASEPDSTDAAPPDMSDEDAADEALRAINAAADEAEIAAAEAAAAEAEQGADTNADGIIDDSAENADSAEAEATAAQADQNDPEAEGADGTTGDGEAAEPENSEDEKTK